VPSAAESAAAAQQLAISAVPEGEISAAAPVLLALLLAAASVEPASVEPASASVARAA
jgi:hypothetical protein